VWDGHSRPSLFVTNPATHKFVESDEPRARTPSGQPAGCQRYELVTVTKGPMLEKCKGTINFFGGKAI